MHSRAVYIIHSKTCINRTGLEQEFTSELRRVEEFTCELPNIARNLLLRNKAGSKSSSHAPKRKGRAYH